MDASRGKIEAQRTWSDSPTGIGTIEGLKPGTRAHFERSLKWRGEIEQPWLPEVVPFPEWASKRVLEVGFGPGYDALTIMRAGAEYSGVDIAIENVNRTRETLARYGLQPDVRHGDAEALPFPDATFDVVYSNGVLHHCPDITAAFLEAHRVLKPNGKFHVILYHRNSVFYWVSIIALGWVFRLGFLKRSLADQRSMIEWNCTGSRPIVNVYSKLELKKLLVSTGFSVSDLKVRKLLPSDLPLSRFLGPLYRLAPQSAYDRVGHTLGWYVCASAVRG